jgi:ABC-type Zn uptake system ZnuABC Zn-binding protein ZnuA
MKAKGIPALKIPAAALILLLLAGACSRQPRKAVADGRPKVLAIENFLADAAAHVAGDRFSVEALLPVGADPHEYEPSPLDVAKVSESSLVIANGAGFEGFLATLVRNASPAGKAGGPVILEASTGLESRAAGAGEPAEFDPHFFMDPIFMIRYVENIRDAFIALDAGNTQSFKDNAASYIAELRELDRWIAAEVSRIPQKKRLLVTNHESLGYFADRYGFTILGTILPGVSSSASASARQIAQLTERITRSGVKAIFLETGASARLAEQVASEAGIKTVTELYTHSLSAPDGPAPTYVDMMHFNVNAIVEGLL